MNRTVVTWTGIVTGDTIVTHIVDRAPALISVQATGTFNGGTVVGLQTSNDGTNFVNVVDSDGVSVSAKTAAFLSNVVTSGVEYKPTVGSGSADSITITLAYWG